MQQHLYLVNDLTQFVRIWALRHPRLNILIQHSLHRLCGELQRAGRFKKSVLLPRTGDERDAVLCKKIVQVISQRRVLFSREC